MKPRLRRFIAKFSVSQVLLLPFTIVIIALLIVVGITAVQVNRQSLYDVMSVLNDDITSRIDAYIRGFVHEVEDINITNREMIRRGILDYHDQARMQQYFAAMVPTYPSVSSIYFGNLEGGLAGSGHDIYPNDIVNYTTETTGFASGTFLKTELLHHDVDGRVLAKVENFDARTRPWFKGAASVDTPYWTDPYVLFTNDGLACANSLAVRNANGALIGVLSIDINLKNLDTFLSQIDFGKDGMGYIVDQSGYLIATSTGSIKDSLLEKGTHFQRLDARNSPNSLVAASARAIRPIMTRDPNMTATMQTSVNIRGADYLIRLSKITLSRGTHWYSVVLISDTAILELILKNYGILMAIVLGLAGLIAATMNLFLDRFVSAPLQRLSNSAESYSVTRTFDFKSGNAVREILNLSRAFTRMGQIINETLNNLETENKERVHNEKLLEVSLREKEILLKELHHRTKNNLNVVAAMLNLELDRISDERSIQAIKRITNKIYSIALVHQMLYKSSDLSRINIVQYIRALADLILSTYSYMGVACEVTGRSDIDILIETAVPCGIALNEIISNSIEHGFGDRHDKKISIDVRKTESDRLHLRIADNGRGFPPGMRVDEMTTLGMRSIHALIEQQMQGSVTISNDGGAVWVLEFPLNLYAPRV